MSRGMASSYGSVAIGLHWAIAALFFGQVALGFTMERVKSMALQFELIQWHKSFGFLILALAGIRLSWRVATGSMPAAPGLSPVERLAARLVQGALLPFVITMVGVATGTIAVMLSQRGQFERAAAAQIYATLLSGFLLTVADPAVADFGLAVALLAPVLASLLTRTPV